MNILLLILIVALAVAFYIERDRLKQEISDITNNDPRVNPLTIRVDKLAKKLNTCCKLVTSYRHQLGRTRTDMKHVEDNLISFGSFIEHCRSEIARANDRYETVLKNINK